MGLLKEFKDFALKGNVMDMAIGVIIGGAFGTIVTSLTDSFINPLIGVFTGGVQKDADGNPMVVGGQFTINGVDFPYGKFISAVIYFIIIALILFLLLKAINTATAKAAKAAEKLKKEKAEEEAAAPEEPSEEVKLLTEIKDILASKQ
jgi:large conductance mechanosensitive channel